jgi:ketosteroid isomerase-like protein
MISVSPEQVRKEVERFWQIMCGKSSDKLEDLYAPDALVISGRAKKPEAANLAIARRARRIREPGAEAIVEIGPLEVQITEPNAAIASYTYKLQQIRPGPGGGRHERQLLGRATQIFQLDPRGRLRIVHEHLSAAGSARVDAAANAS